MLSKLETLEDYAVFLRGNTKELDSLYSDVLISVTSFFRNPETFDVLQRKVFPTLLKQPGDEPIRVWVLGCSTGQEAYSLAMTFLESADNVSRLRKLQVFATDVNDTLLDKARNGLYPKNVDEVITPERLWRFFVEEQGGYRVCKMLRDMVVFARQNLIADTPFFRMDLVSCRNLLIYLEPSLQKKAMPTFHYALKPNGFLLLGASESIGGFNDLFEPVDKKCKIYCKKPAASQATQLPLKRERDDYGVPSRRPLPLLHHPGTSYGSEGFCVEHNNVQREADRITIGQFAPPGVVINAELQVLQFRGPTGAYLEPPIGKASFDVLKMAREGLMLPLRSAINEAKQQNKPVRKENVRIQHDVKNRTISLEVIPLKNVSESCYLILFDDAEKGRRVVPAIQAKQFDILANDVGRPISHIRHQFVFDDAEKSPVNLEVLGAAVIADVQGQEREVRDNAGRWHLLRVRPYITLDNKVDGAVLVLLEIEALKRSEQRAIAASRYAENAFETVREPMLVLNHDLRVEIANRAFYNFFRIAPAETIGVLFFELGNRQWDIPRLRELLGKVPPPL